MKKLYIIGPSNQGEGVYYLLTEDGYCLASHLCSHIGYAEGDLIEGRPERKEEWKEYLKDGYEIKVCNTDEKMKIIEKNQNFNTEEKREEYRKNILKEITVTK